VIKAVTFDCWGTLIQDYDFASATAVRVRAIAEAAEGKLSPEAARELLDRAWREHHHHWLDGKQYGSPGIARFVADELGDQAIYGLLQESFEDAGRHGRIEEVPGARLTLEVLRRAGIRTALVCDAGMTPGRIVRDFLDGLGLLEYLEFCAFSDEVGVPKPSPKMFEAALTGIASRPSDAVHVGDLLRTDVDGARSFGMRTIRITAVNDDSRKGFSWDANAILSGEKAVSGPAPFHDADAIVGSHAELLETLLRMGARLD
jgi:putative hydrolase of the HAD superfamily